MSDQSARVREVFDDWARRGRAQGMADAHMPVVSRVLHALTMPDDAWFLDIGCGSGYVVRWAAERLPRGRAFGVDVSSEMIQVSRLDAPPRATFVQGAFPDVDLPEARFDTVFSMEVFYYLADLDAALRAVHRLLRPGGWFFCVVDYYEENEASHGWPAELGVAMDRRSERQWAAAFASAGFEPIRQQRILVPPEETKEAFRTTVGSLLTCGRRA